MAYLPLILLVLVALGTGATTLAIIISVRASREARATFFPIVREEEGLRALRARIASILFLALTALALGGWLATQRGWPLSGIAQQSPPAEVIETEAVAIAPTTSQPVVLTPAAPTETTAIPPTMTFTPEPTATDTAVLPSPTLSPTAPARSTSRPTNTPASVRLITETVIFTGTGGVSVTVTASPVTDSRATATSVPEPTEEEVGLDPPPPGAQLGPIAFALDITDRREAIDPAQVFTAPVEAVYAAFPYSGLRNGLIFSAVWYHDGQEFLRDEREWEWGSEDRSYVFARLVGPGVYRVELLLNNEVRATGTFEVN